MLNVPQSINLHEELVLIDQHSIINQTVLENSKSLKTFSAMATDRICSLMSRGQTFETQISKIREFKYVHYREDICLQTLFLSFKCSKP